MKDKVFALFMGLMVASLFLFYPYAMGGGKGKGPKVKLPIPLPQTGQTQSYYDYDDGWYQMGVDLPEPRFTDNGDGTVTDHLTGRIWQQDFDYHGPMDWYSACIACYNMADDGVNLLDGSQIGDWRLPNIRELLSLYDWSQRSMPIPPFLGPTDWQCWSSTTLSWEDEGAHTFYFSFGWIDPYLKTSVHPRVLCVRGGQKGIVI